MATLDLSGVTSFPRTVNETLSATPGNVRLVKLPRGNWQVFFRARTTAASYIDPATIIATPLAEDAAVGSAAAMTLPASATPAGFNFYRQDNPSRDTTGPTFGLASTTASQVVEITIARVTGR